ncbi:hypothetical protein Pfo_015879 [Paulownia fortunei]|nr:hypothetical protein Pfo_015879 [Paulownia fortunei]
MAFWLPLLVIAFACAICRFLLMLIPSNVPSIDVDASDVLDDGNQTKENSFIYIPSRRHTDKVQCYEPETMKYLGHFPALKPDEVKERVALARKSQRIWAKSSFKQRCQFLRILLKYIIEHQELICEVASCDTGKTMVDASLGEIMTTCEKITWLLSEGEYQSGVIVSWNYPFHSAFNPMLAAVFLGNSIVIKVSEHASWSESLVSSVNKIIFVGSLGVGKIIMGNAAYTLILVTRELCGKDAFIVCEDVDVPHLRGFFVHKNIYFSFVAKVVKIVKYVTAGPPLVGKYDIGAICMQKHSGKLQSLVRDSLDKAAEIVGRGSVGNIGEGAVDQYFPPTVIVNVNHTMKLMQEEAFGPIMPIMNLVLMKRPSQRRAKEIASHLHCGVTAFNDFASTSYSLPFGGVKDSGFGRFAGVEGLRACCLVKYVVVDRWWLLIKTKIPKPIQLPARKRSPVWWISWHC